MSQDFHKMLGLRRGATEYAIRRAYRKLALRFHRDNNHHSHAAKRFEQVAEAFDALSDKRKRDLFDTPGEMGLQRRRCFFLCYQYQSDPYATFAKVFGSRNAPSETSENPNMKKNKQNILLSSY
ncbi:dnaJ protein homolog 1 [Drosophila suzukii]|uniref:DnaJ protein homolog 1 n=1 Tax=Drosophila suzukii TaxID=28584 RepID=A0ABM4TTR8_DROSZ